MHGSQSHCLKQVFPMTVLLAPRETWLSTHFQSWCCIIINGAPLETVVLWFLTIPSWQTSGRLTDELVCRDKITNFVLIPCDSSLTILKQLSPWDVWWAFPCSCHQTWLARWDNTISSWMILRLYKCWKNSCSSIWVFIMTLTHHFLNAIHPKAQLPMPFEKFFLCDRHFFIFSSSHASIAEIQNMFWTKCTVLGRSPSKLPRSLSWKKSRGLMRVWHKSECILEDSAFFASLKQMNQRWRGGYVPPS